MASIVRETRYKIIVAGDPEVGKTSIINRFNTKDFEKRYIATVGFQISTTEVKIKDKDKISLLIWDIAGQPQFHLIREKFYIGASGIIYVFDVCNRPSFYNIKNWVRESRRHVPGGIPCILVGNKTDLKNNRVIIKPQANNLAEQLGFRYIETSAKTGKNIKNLFHHLSKDIYKYYQKMI
ncbi:MAG: GTP-binding protein [Candidatus Lokiarchaeota archaeon]|nr:GTP-binding protein [Candidatus Lokiarchaeota archaeon]